MTPISFFVPGDPRPQPRPRARMVTPRVGKPFVHIYSPEEKEWKTAIKSFALPHVPFPPLTGPLKVEMKFYFDRPQAHLNSKGLKQGAPTWHAISRFDVDNIF